MSLRDDLDSRMRQARKDRDERTKNVINQLKNKVLTELKSGSGVQDDDELWLRNIAAVSGFFTYPAGRRFESPPIPLE